MTEEIFETPPSSPNFQTEIAQKLADLIPEALVDGKLDLDKVREFLSDDLAEPTERFGLFWPGKKRALRAAQTPTIATLKVDSENSVDWEKTENLFIEGDNLEVLKVLQKHYHGKIKVIYIDPPYNTGKDFVYPDNFKDGIAAYLQWTKQVSDDGKKMSSNSETDGRYHSNWLNMMYPRLKLARNLLSKDGIVMISIGETELGNLLKLADEVFGESNRVATFIWKKRGTGGQVAKNAIIKQTEHILMYARSAEHLSLSGPKNDDEGEEGWRDFRKSGGQWQRQYRPNQYFAFWLSPNGTLTFEETPGAKAIYPQDSNGVDGYWENGLETARARLIDGDFRVKNAKQGLKIEQRTVAKATSNAGSFIDVPSTRGTDEIKDYFGDNVVFENPKPTDLLKALFTIANIAEGETVLDFFAGSGSTADAVMQMNAADGVNRKWIAVQLPEPVDEKDMAAAAGFKTISELSRARIKAVALKIGETITSQKFDFGFRAFKLSDTNFAKWQLSSSTEESALQDQILGLRESARDDANSIDLLFEILIKQGYSLSEKVGEVEIDGLLLNSVGDGLVLAYLNEQIKPSLANLRKVVDAEPPRLIVLEDAFQGDDELKTNLAQLCKSKGIELWTA